MMESLEQIKSRIESAVAGAKIDIVPNASPSQQSSLLIDNEHAREIAKFLRDDPALRFDFCSNATGVDWLDRVVTKKVKVKKIIEGAEKEVEETQQETISGYLEAVYHLYSIQHKAWAGNYSGEDERSRSRRAFALADAHLAQRRISRARNLRSVRHSLRRSSRYAAHPDVG